jgi:hypothetical protein
MPTVFVCSANQERAKTYCKHAFDLGVAPFAPHSVYPDFLSEEVHRVSAIDAGLQWLKRCEEVWVYVVDGLVTEGMRTEIETAIETNKNIKYFAVDGDTVVSLDHIDTTKVPTQTELMTVKDRVGSIGALLSQYKTQLESGEPPDEILDAELDKLLGTGYSERDRQLEADWSMQALGCGNDFSYDPEPSFLGNSKK